MENIIPDLYAVEVRASHTPPFALYTPSAVVLMLAVVVTLACRTIWVCMQPKRLLCPPIHTSATPSNACTCPSSLYPPTRPLLCVCVHAQADLADAYDHVAPCFPPAYNIFETLFQMYHVQAGPGSRRGRHWDARPV
jgi:hypothetical protein